MRNQAYTSDPPLSSDKTMPDTPPVPSSLLLMSIARFFPFHSAWLGIMVWIDLSPSRAFRPDTLASYRDKQDTRSKSKSIGVV